MSTTKLQAIIILLFFIVFSYFNIWEYLDYQKNKNYLTNTQELNKQKVSTFSLGNIRNLEEIKLETTPSKNLLTKIIKKIENAKKHIYIEIYMFTNKKLVSAIVKAKKKGIDIKVIMEKNPYKIPKLNDKTYKTLKDNNIDVVWSNANNYSLNHSKMILIDDEIIISTWNLTYSTFTKNKDIFLFIKDKILLNKLNKIFLHDYKWEKIWEYEDNIILSPNYSREKLKILITSAKKEIKISFPYLEDDKFKNLIIKKVQNWIRVNIIVGKKFFDENTLLINELRSSWIKINYLKKYKLHSKSILIDNKYLYIWSINFSYYSLDKNREIWILTKNTNIIKQFLSMYNFK